MPPFNALYLQRHWYCEECGRRGYVMQHVDDTPQRAEGRRSQSHGAQVNRKRGENRCAGRLLIWTVKSEATDAAF